MLITKSMKKVHDKLMERYFEEKLTNKSNSKVIRTLMLLKDQSIAPVRIEFQVRVCREKELCLSA